MQKCRKHPPPAVWYISHGLELYLGDGQSEARPSVRTDVPRGLPHSIQVNGGISSHEP
jgi:hypothetical protein